MSPIRNQRSSQSGVNLVFAYDNEWLSKTINDGLRDADVSEPFPLTGPQEAAVWNSLPRDDDFRSRRLM
jgi:hypothetical protein